MTFPRNICLHSGIPVSTIWISIPVAAGFIGVFHTPEGHPFTEMGKAWIWLGLEDQTCEPKIRTLDVDLCEFCLSRHL